MISDRVLRQAAHEASGIMMESILAEVAEMRSKILTTSLETAENVEEVEIAEIGRASCRERV